MFWDTNVIVGDKNSLPKMIKTFSSYSYAVIVIETIRHQYSDIVRSLCSIKKHKNQRKKANEKQTLA